MKKTPKDFKKKIEDISKKLPHLYRVDLHIKYFVLTQNDKYGSHEDILEWLQTQCNCDELEAAKSCIVDKINDLKDIEDIDWSYVPYNVDNSVEKGFCNLNLKEIVNMLHLDNDNMIRTLEARGFKVEKIKN